MKNTFFGLRGLIIGIIIGLCVYLIKRSIWVNEVPQWISSNRWLFGALLGVITIIICYFVGLEKDAVLVAGGVLVSFAFSFKNENKNNF